MGMSNVTQTSLDLWAKRFCRLEELEAQYVHQWFYTLCQLATRGNDEKCISEHNAMLASRADLQRITSTITAPLPWAPCARRATCAFRAVRDRQWRPVSGLTAVRAAYLRISNS